ncbi:glutamate ABC transporter substrate-binding protein [Acrocarpospora macrocephala]|uniref:ABC transporter substrate-binding protein n=1 Tax=Acrocarpospora macrocephala TaxID=150177 RepID=A0A5M3X5B5_9ACTN|nr:transporter substrate-binding domain-containing protein [Acrocarpospora macrocephala]GES16270.1 ABC transporter substrate-binding protein [Acrocarpospora macrocephala]
MASRSWNGRRHAVVPLAMLLGLVPACAPGSSEPPPEKYLSGTVQIGVNTDIPGWSLYSNGVWDGFDIKLGNWLGTEIGFRPQYTPLTDDERMIKLKETTEAEQSNGNGPGIKLVMANFSITDERRQDVDFAGPYFIDSQGVLVGAGSDITKVEDIRNKIICTSRGSTTETRLFDMDIQPAPENTLQKCVERLLDGEVDAVSTDRVILESFAARHPGRLRLVPGIRVGSERYGIGFPDNRPRLCTFLTSSITKFINEEWDQKLKDALPGVPPEDRKPNSDALDPCEPSDQEQAAAPANGLNDRRITVPTSIARRTRAAAREGQRQSNRRRQR